MTDIVLQKKASIERCIVQIRKYYKLDPGQSFKDDYLRQDAIALNLQRACEQSIDLANYVIRIKSWVYRRPRNKAFNYFFLPGFCLNLSLIE